MPPQLRKVSRGQVARPPAGHPSVEGDDDCFEASFFGAPHQTLRERSVGGRVELETARRGTEFARHVLEWVDGQCRGYHWDASHRGGASDSHVAVAIGRAQADDTDRTHKDGG